MPSVITTILLVILIQFNLKAQVIPKEASVLNYRLIGFSFPPKKQSQNYSVEIASGNLNEEKLFKKNIVKTETGRSNRIIATVPAFGAQYTWRVIYYPGSQNKSISPFYHFNTGVLPEVDTNNIRLRITKQASGYKEGYVLLDGSKVMYDMAGQPVWYLPFVEGTRISPRDLKITTHGSITFLEGDGWEINYNGRILWKAPNNGMISGQAKEFYHHEFTRLSNGHYMIYGNEFLFCSQNADGTFKVMPEEKNANPKSFLGVLIEYDESGKIIWKWKTADYFNTSDLRYYKSPNNAPMIDLHENSFFFNEKEKVIYISIKYLNRIIKIKYPEGTVINTFGETCKPGETNLDNPLFCGQHSISQSLDGYLYLFNNNLCQPGKYPTVVKLQEPRSKDEPLKKVWEYEFPSEEHGPDGYPSGGNILELPGKAIFVSTAGPDNKLYIISSNKEILWSAVAEKWSELEKKWTPLPSYRASIIINRLELENLIWNSMKNEIVHLP